MSWFEKQINNVIGEIGNRIGKSRRFRGKSGSSDLTPVGAWEALVGTIAYKDSSEIWETYTDGDKEKIYSKSGVVYACVRKIVSAAQEPTLRIGREVEEGFEYVDDDILGLMKNPNHLMNYRQWLGVVVANLLLTGQCFVWEWRDNAGYLTELWPIPKSWVKQKTDSDGKFTHYTIRQGSKEVAVRPEDMTSIYMPDPANPLVGLGPLQAALRDYQTDSERQNYLAEMLTNLKVPGLVLKQQEGWDEKQKSEARALISDLIGRKHRGGPLFLSGEGATVELMAPLKDLDWPGVTGLSETRICACFGVPPITIGLRAGLDAGTYANYQQADRSFYGQTMTSVWLNLESAFTKGFLRDEQEEDTTLEFKYDLSTVVQLKEDRIQAAERATKSFLGGIITRNEAREMIDLEQLDPTVGDVLVMPMNLIEIPVGDEAIAAMEDEEEEEEIDHDAGLEEEEEEEEEGEEENGNGNGKGKTVKWRGRTWKVNERIPG